MSALADVHPDTAPTSSTGKDRRELAWVREDLNSAVLARAGSYETYATPQRAPAGSHCAHATPYGSRALSTTKRARLAELERQVRGLRFAERETLPRCPSGLAALDAALGGGFVGGALHEVLARQDGSAAGSVALLTAARAAGRRGWILYVDTAGDFYPPGAARLGVPLGRLLVVHAPRHADALWVGEQALRCRGVSAVVLPLRHIDAYASRRLQLAAEQGRGLGLLIREWHAHASGGRASPGHTFAATRVCFDPLVGETAARRAWVTVLKLREGRPPEPFALELPDAAGDVSAHAVSAERPGSPRRSAAAAG